MLNGSVGPPSPYFGSQIIPFPSYDQRDLLGTVTGVDTGTTCTMTRWQAREPDLRRRHHYLPLRRGHPGTGGKQRRRANILTVPESNEILSIGAAIAIRNALRSVLCRVNDNGTECSERYCFEDAP